MARGIERGNLKIKPSVLRVPIERQKSGHMPHRRCLHGDRYDRFISLLRLERNRYEAKESQGKQRSAHEIVVARDEAAASQQLATVISASVANVVKDRTATPSVMA